MSRSAKPEASAAVALGQAHRSVSLGAGMLICVVALALLVLALTREVPASVVAQGVVWPREGISRVGSPRAGVVEKVLVEQGAVVEERQPLMVIRHRLVPSQEVAAIQKREEMLRVRLDEVQSAIDRTGQLFGAGDRSGERLALVRLEDEISASLVALRDKLNQLRDEASTTLYAPRRGRVVELRADVGAEVGPRQALATLVAMQPDYRVRAYVTPPVATRLAPGVRADIQFGTDAQAGSRRGGAVLSVSSLPVAPADVDRSVWIEQPLYEVEIHLEAGDESTAVGLAPGMPVVVSFQLDRQRLYQGMLGRFGLE